MPLTKPTAVALAAAWCVAWPVGTAAWAEDGSALEPSPAPEEVGLVERLLERSAANKATNDALRCYEGVYAQLGRRAGMDLDSGMDSTVPRAGRLTEFQAAELKRRYGGDSYAQARARLAAGVEIDDATSPQRRALLNSDGRKT